MFFVFFFTCAIMMYTLAALVQLTSCLPSSSLHTNRILMKSFLLFTIFFNSVSLLTGIPDLKLTKPHAVTNYISNPPALGSYKMYGMRSCNIKKNSAYFFLLLRSCINYIIYTRKGRGLATSFREV